MRNFFFFDACPKNPWVYRKRQEKVQNIMYKTPAPMTSAFKYWKEGGSGPAVGLEELGSPLGW